MVKYVDAAIVRQRHVKHVSAATDTHATTEEMLEAAFSAHSMPWSYNKNLQGSQFSHERVLRQSSASKNMSMEAEEYLLLTVTIKQQPETTKTD